jgi:hypothetical protein
LYPSSKVSNVTVWRHSRRFTETMVAHAVGSIITQWAQKSLSGS